MSSPYRCQPRDDISPREAVYVAIIGSMIECECDGFAIVQKADEAKAACGEQIMRHFQDLRDARVTHPILDPRD